MELFRRLFEHQHAAGSALDNRMAGTRPVSQSITRLLREFAPPWVQRVLDGAQPGGGPPEGAGVPGRRHGAGPAPGAGQRGRRSGGRGRRHRLCRRARRRARGPTPPTRALSDRGGDPARRSQGRCRVRPDRVLPHPRSAARGGHITDPPGPLSPGLHHQLAGRGPSGRSLWRSGGFLRRPQGHPTPRDPGPPLPVLHRRPDPGPARGALRAPPRLFDRARHQTPDHHRPRRGGVRTAFRPTSAARARAAPDRKPSHRSARPRGASRASARNQPESGVERNNPRIPHGGGGATCVVRARGPRTGARNLADVSRRARRELGHRRRGATGASACSSRLGA